MAAISGSSILQIRRFHQAIGRRNFLAPPPPSPPRTRLQFHHRTPTLPLLRTPPLSNTTPPPPPPPPTNNDAAEEEEEKDFPKLLKLCVYLLICNFVSKMELFVSKMELFILKTKCKNLKSENEMLFKMKCEKSKEEMLELIIGNELLVLGGLRLAISLNLWRFSSIDVLDSSFTYRFCVLLAIDIIALLLMVLHVTIFGFF